MEYEEEHQVYMAAKEDVGNKIEVAQILRFVKMGTCPILDGDNFDLVFDRIVSAGGPYTIESLISEREYVKNDESKSFSNIINDYRDSLKAKSLGSLASAKSIIPLVKAARKSSKDDISKALHSKKNQKIL